MSARRPRVEPLPLAPGVALATLGAGGVLVGLMMGPRGAGGVVDVSSADGVLGARALLFATAWIVVGATRVALVPCAAWLFLGSVAAVLVAVLGHGAGNLWPIEVGYHALTIAAGLGAGLLGGAVTRAGLDRISLRAPALRCRRAVALSGFLLVGAPFFWLEFAPRPGVHGACQVEVAHVAVTCDGRRARAAHVRGRLVHGVLRRPSFSRLDVMLVDGALGMTVYETDRWLTGGTDDVFDATVSIDAAPPPSRAVPVDSGGTRRPPFVDVEPIGCLAK